MRHRVRDRRCVVTVHLQAQRKIHPSSGDGRGPINRARRGVVQKPSDRAHTTLAYTPAARRYREKNPLVADMDEAQLAKHVAASSRSLPIARRRPEAFRSRTHNARVHSCRPQVPREASNPLRHVQDRTLEARGRVRNVERDAHTSTAACAGRDRGARRRHYEENPSMPRKREDMLPEQLDRYVALYDE